MGEVSSIEQNDQSPKPRIVQYKNRRFSVRLEPIYWQVLERMADRATIRLGQLIARLAADYPGGNFSSFLRVYCMLEAERRLAQQQMEPNYNSLLDLVKTCPNPGVILSRYRSIIGSNDAFLNWIGPLDTPINGANLTSVIQVRTRNSLNDVWQQMLSGRLAKAEARILYVAPGRVNAAKATFVALHAERGEEFYAVMWLAVANTTPALKPSSQSLPAVADERSTRRQAAVPPQDHAVSGRR
jgi:predicted DNA-binding ribbon-helix-helix protein